MKKLFAIICICLSIFLINACTTQSDVKAMSNNDISWNGVPFFKSIIYTINVEKDVDYVDLEFFIYVLTDSSKQYKENFTLRDLNFGTSYTHTVNYDDEITGAISFNLKFLRGRLK